MSATSLYGGSDNGVRAPMVNAGTASLWPHWAATGYASPQATEEA